MIIRVILALFISVASGTCFLAGLTRLMSALLVSFGALAAVFFGIFFLLPEASRESWFPVYGEGYAWPFFLLAFVLACVAGFIITSSKVEALREKVSASHYQYLIGGFFANLLSVFLPAFFLFPSDERRFSLDQFTLGLYVFGGTCLYLIGTTVSLYLFYLASKGAAANYPDLMRRLVLAIFSVFHFDKFPALIAFLLVYSPEAGVIYPSAAMVALAGYIPVSLFLLKVSRQSDKSIEDETGFIRK